MTVAEAVPAAALPVADRATVRRATAALMKSRWRSVAVSVALYSLAAAAGLGGPWLVGKIVNSVKAGAGLSTINDLAAGIVVFAVSQLLLTRFAQRAGYRLGEQVLADLRELVIQRVVALPAETVERVGIGDLTTRSSQDVAAVALALRDALPQLVIAVFQITFVLAAACILSVPLGVCGILGLSGIWFAFRWYIARARTAYLAEGAANSGLAEVLGSTAEGARTIELLGLQDSRLAATETAIKKSRKARMRTLFLRSVLFPIIEFSYSIPVAAVLVVGVLIYDHGSVSLGVVVSCTLYMWQLVNPLDQLVLWLDPLQSSGASYARILGIPEPQGQLGDVDSGGDDGPVDGGPIEVQEVSYAYVAGTDVLHDVSLEIAAGERLALVGPSGAGKSTLGRLIAGIESPKRGRVLVGGQDLARLSAAARKQHVVLVTQEQHIFIGSLRENLGLAHEGASDAEMIAALDAVDADWFAELPEGLDTELGVGGRKLDAAKAQQVALARVVLANPRTLVLDEATSMLDPTAARRTERSLARVLDGRTVIAIAHRLHTAHDADRVAVMHEGKIAELGTHETLVAAGGRYSGLWHSWHG